jgi:hypothetical protein
MIRFIQLLAASAVVSACGVPESSPSSTNQSCNSSHECVNGACTCKAGPRSGQSCCDPARSTCGTDRCTDFCRFCN